MTDTILSVNFGTVDGLTEKFWARIEVQPPESDFVTLSEAAKVIDSIYDVDPCTQDSALVGGQAGVVFEPEDVQPTLAHAFGAIRYDPCKYIANTFDYEAVLYIYRSHFDIPYKLVVNSGTIIRTQVEEKTIKTLVKPEERKIEVDFPILGNIECEEEIDSFIGAQVLLKKDYTKNLAFTYDTKYDKVTIRVNGSSTEALDAECLVFYKGLAYSEIVSKPEEDSTAINFLGCTSTDFEREEEEEEEVEDSEVCYQRYIYSDVCECSGEIKNSYDTVEQVPCPDSPATPHSDTEQGALNFWWQARHINNYIACPEEDAWEGTDPGFFLETCCVPVTPETMPPYCQERTESWLGGAEIIKGPEFYIENAFHDEQIILVPVGPEDGVCGTVKYIQEVEAQNCCDDEFLTPIVIDTENSAEIIADNSSGVIFWEGGKAPYEVSVRGSGFFLDKNYTMTDAVTDGTAIRVYTQDSCGGADFNVTDNCSEADVSIKSSEGYWELIESGASVTEKYKGYEGEYSYSDIYNYYYTHESGKIKITQRTQPTGGSGRGGWVPPGLPCMSDLLCGYYVDTFISNWYDNPLACLSFKTAYVPPDPYTMCYENDWQFCYTNKDTLCGNNQYQPNYCVRSSETRAKVYYSVTLEEWKC